VRTHGTTRAKPLALFELERRHLQPLPAAAPDLGSWHRVSVHRDCHVQFERALYSAPFALVGKSLWLRATDAAVALYDELRHVATHPRAQRAGQRITVRDHLPPQAQAFFAHDRAWCVEQASRVGPSCQRLVEQLLGDAIVERLRAAQGVIQLAKQFGAARLEAACERALSHGSPHYRTVKTILATGADRQAAASTIDTPAGYATASRFARDAASLFASPQPQQDLLH